jgi:predicted HTH transcriptional regulator
MDNLFETNDKGYIKHRESFDLEFKENFHLGNKLLEYCRTLVGMANNKGGQIVFGITDKPRIPKGMTNDKFATCDPAKINQTLMEYFSHEIEWNMESIEYNGQAFGILSVKEANVKPVLCRKNGDKVLKEAAIYYRYRGETKEINFPELSNIL